MTDSCPACCARAVPPAVTRRRGGRIVHAYRCHRCGHQWTTGRLLAAYRERRRRAA